MTAAPAHVHVAQPDPTETTSEPETITAADLPESMGLPSASEQPVGRRAQQRANTRERLFQCALEEFRVAGMAGAQIDRIAKAAGVVRGTFYFHFATKDHVLFELQRRVEHRTLQRVEELEAEAPLEAVLNRTVEAIIEAVALANSGEVLREMMSLYVRHPSWHEEGMELPASDAGLTLADVLASHFESGQQRNEIRTDLSAPQLSSMFLTSTFGFVSHHQDDDLRQLLSSLIDVVARGIRA
jgi:AcrR family transcriptional regulator